MSQGSVYCERDTQFGKCSVTKNNDMEALKEGPQQGTDIFH